VLQGVTFGRIILIVSKSETGIVKWYDNRKGFGVIARDAGGEVYIHYSSVVCEESDCLLAAGVKVKYSIFRGPRGNQAQNVIILN
jgi:CspA family cold shock protein